MSNVVEAYGWKPAKGEMFEWQVTVTPDGLTFNEAFVARLRSYRHEFFAPYTAGDRLLLVANPTDGGTLKRSVLGSGQGIFSPSLMEAARLVPGTYKVRHEDYPSNTCGYIIEGCVAAEEEQSDE